MKKLFIFIFSMLVVTDMMAQDIYTVGYITSTTTGNHVATLYKNGSKVKGGGDYYNRHTESDAVTFFRDTVYWVENCMDTAGNKYMYGDILRGDGTRYLSNIYDGGTHINALFHSNINLFAAGTKKIDGVTTAVLWRDNDPTPLRIMGNKIHSSYAYCGTILYDDTKDVTWAITGGVQYDDTSYHGVIWKSASVLYTLPNRTYVYGVACYQGNVYSVGISNENGYRVAKVWKNASEFYTLTSSTTNARAWSISIDAGDIYVCGWEGTTLKVWKNGTVLHSHSAGSSNMYAVVANNSGVYYAGHDHNVGKVWKDGTEQYTINDCKEIKDMCVVEPKCADNARALPFFEGFEKGATSWKCWTKIDKDKYNGIRLSYWDRRGERSMSDVDVSIPTGKYVAAHSFSLDTLQEGWLISPKLAIKSTSNIVTLTFKSYDMHKNDYRYEGVWVSTTTDDMSSFREVWTPTNVSASWKTITVDLSAYKGQNIYIAFKYTGKDGHVWFIDDVNVTEKNTTAIEDADATNAQVSVYPNPAKNMLYVNGIAENSTKMVEIYDMTGRKVKQQPATENMSIDIADLAKGVYVLSAGYQKIKFVKE